MNSFIPKGFGKIIQEQQKQLLGEFLAEVNQTRLIDQSFHDLLFTCQCMLSDGQESAANIDTVSAISMADMLSKTMTAQKTQILKKADLKLSALDMAITATGHLLESFEKTQWAWKAAGLAEAALADAFAFEERDVLDQESLGESDLLGIHFDAVPNELVRMSMVLSDEDDIEIIRQFIARLKAEYKRISCQRDAALQVIDDIVSRNYYRANEFISELSAHPNR